MNHELAIGIVGATGLVGETFCRLLEKSSLPIKELRPFASERSQGQKLSFRNQKETLQVLGAQCFEGLDVVFFSSGDPISREWAPQAVAQGAIAIDNSAAFRMDPQIPLVVPEINFDHIEDPAKAQIIANPNCSTIQLVMVLNALKDQGLSHVRVASYQSVSGAGKEGIEDLHQQTEDVLQNKTPRPGKNFQRSIAFEAQPQIGSLNPEGFCSEETKIMNETKKILSLPDLPVSAFTVRIPTFNGHGEAVWVSFSKNTSLEAIEQNLGQCSYISYLPANEDKNFHSYAEVNGQTNAFVSRLRQDPSQANTFMMWVVADNLYRGAAANGLLIAEKIFANKLNN